MSIVARWARGRLRDAIVFSAIAIVTALASWPVAANADHIKARFPSMNGGTLWMSGYEAYQGIVAVVSSNCNASETATYADIKSTTTGKPEMTRWLDGIQMSRYKCDNIWDYSADLRISYMDQSNFLQSDGHYIGGRNVDVQASADYCSTWLASYPCGSRPNVQINQQKFFGNSTSYQQSELTHETGHGLGLAHHCTGASIMNDGSTTCYGGRFGSAPGYFATDRTGINNVYP